MLTLQVLNTKGAARRLGCSETWIHKLAATGKLKAYIYGDEGELVEHEKADKKPGRALYFLADDVVQYYPAVQRRPRGSKNKFPRTSHQMMRSQIEQKNLDDRRSETDQAGSSS